MLQETDWWRLPTLGLWTLFFAVGLLPEPFFFALRDWGGVTTFNALVNSPYVLSLALAGYIGFFAFHRCRQALLSIFESQDRALQLTLIALVAFLPIDPVTAITAYKAPSIITTTAVYLAVGLKLGGWLYLVVLFARYYLGGIDDVFSRIPSMFPSTRRAAATKEETPSFGGGDAGASESTDIQ
jgi:hypothetical protein